MRSSAGRVLGSAVVAVLVMSVVGLAATETFINKMGKTVIGIKIEFSKSVMITRHDSVFPDQSPNGRSQEFTFSGGELHNFGRFSISWLPSLAKVTHYEWMKKTEPAPPAPQLQPAPVKKEQEFKLPDPNTPPILYGNDYPGPDEPLYQPKPDEQIWLTDADGHGDIYDNDSIKINYASGFDKSQITKIDVYRNGIKLRFLPEKFDVLTNAQMKTFDGNPAEHSPASNHTDHAIMGYEYKFEIHTADDLWMFTKTVESGFRWHPKEIWAGMSHTWMDSVEEVSYNDMVAFFSKLHKDGFTGISLNLPYYFPTPYDNNIHELLTSDLSILPWSLRSPTLEELDSVLEAMTQAGLKAKVMTMFYVSQSYMDAHKDRFIGKAMMNPKDPKLFFENSVKYYGKFLPLFNKYHVASFTVLDETDTLDVKDSYFIRDMLAHLSKSFNSDLAIDISGDSALLGFYWNQNGRSFQRVMDEMKFLGWVSPAGEPMNIEYSCWAPPLETRSDQRARAMATNFVKFWKPLFGYVASIYPNHPQSFGEIGVYNTDGVCLGPTYYDISDKIMDDQEVSDVWYAYFKGAGELEVDGVNGWAFSIGELYSGEEADGDILNTGFRYSESPGYRVITSIIKPDE